MSTATPPPPGPPRAPTEAESLARAASEALHSAAHSAEEFAEQASIDAKRSIFLHWGWRGLRATQIILRAAGIALLAGWFAFGAAVLTTRYFMLPHIGDWRGDIEAAAAAALHAPVTIGGIDASWEGLYPRLLLRDVRVQGPDGKTALSLPKVDAVVSWMSLLALQPRMHALTIVAPEVAVEQLADHRWRIGGIPIDLQQTHSQGGGLEWLLAQRRIGVVDARVRYTDAGAPALQFTDVNFLLERGLFFHRFALQVRPPAHLAGVLDVRGQVHPPFLARNAPLQDWEGRVYAQFDFADLAGWGRLLHVVPPSVRLDQAQGALRVWFDFAGTGAQRIRADFALAGVDAQLRPDLQPLRLDRVAGTLTAGRHQTRDADVREIRVSGLHLSGESVTLPPTDLVYVNRQFHHPQEDGAQQHVQLRANRLALGDLSRLAALIPLPQSWQNAVHHAAARGALENLEADWDDPVTATSAFQVRTDFSQLGLTLDGPAPANDPASQDRHRPQPRPLPALQERGTSSAQRPVAPRRYAFDNLSGNVDAGRETGSTEHGTLRIDSAGVALHADKVLVAPHITFDRLTATLRWRNTPNAPQGQGLQIDLDSLRAENGDLAFDASGRYRAQDPAAPLDLRGRIRRARVAGVAQYLPIVLRSASRRWLTGALRDGQVTGGSFHLQGDPRKFPFADPQTGDFQASLRVAGGRIDIDPVFPGAPARVHWPAISGIDAEVTFDRNRLTVRAAHAQASGYPLTDITARVSPMEHPGAHLLIDGQGAGDLHDLLRYVGASPVDVRTGGWLATSRGSGPTRLDVHLDIPLADPKQTQVAGAVDFQGDTLTLVPGLAPFTALAGHLAFTARTARLTDMHAGFLGGTATIAGDTLPDGTLVVHGAGTATPRGARPQVPTTFLRRIVDHTEGEFRYAATVTVRHGRLGYRVDSDLVGLKMDLPAPLRKDAATPLPLHIESTPAAAPSGAMQAARQDFLRVRLGTLVDAALYEVHAPTAGAAPGTGMTTRIDRGAIGIGTPAVAPRTGVTLRIDQDQLDIDRWRAIAAPPAAGAKKESAGAEAESAAALSAQDLAWLDTIRLRARQIQFAGRSLADVTLTARRDDGVGWAADLVSDQAAGSLHWLGSGRGETEGRLTARLTRLAIPAGQQEQVSNLLDAAPRDFPALDIIADRFQLGDHRLGRLELTAKNIGAGNRNTWILERFVLINRDGRITANGQWQRIAAAPAPATTTATATGDKPRARRKMDVDLVIFYTDAGQMLGRFGFPGLVRGGKGTLKGHLSWIGSPFAIDYPTLTGTLHDETGHGQFLHADMGAARLLGVLSLQSLGHRLTGDFRDLFSEGFAFDSLTGTAAIANGTLTTDDFIMKGLNAVVRVRGSADLRAETQDLTVVVIPEINAGTASLAYAALINPAVGLGAFIANYLLRKPLSEAFTNAYRVTGPWSHPKVQTISQ